ncbi:MAG: pyridoxal-phosphate dependent enzyme [Gammaproteobacteria bacterium]|nr:pyridoxal-phosphate dependent enzyme [Gammaproteobacteria bacterium]
MLDYRELQLPSPIQSLSSDFLRQHDIRLFVKRDDLIHPIIQGNKWRKLKYNLQQARTEHHHTLLSFGGAYSNHIHALAAAGQLFGFNTIGIIRGAPLQPLNPTLQDVSDRNMQLGYLSRADYRHKTSPEILQRLHQCYGDFYLIPEGGSNQLAVKGAAEIIDELEQEFDVVCAACGTGATLAGLITGLNNHSQLLGFSALKGADFLYDDITRLLQIASHRQYDNWTLNLDYHFGGFAKTRPELFNFITEFQQQYGITLEPVYTGKMFYGLFDLIAKGYFKPGSRILAIHSGGLQGLRGFRT